MPMIEVEDLRKNYGSFRALSGVDFEVNRGEILGFLGPNGAGKTTTMKILTGFLHPSGGRASVDGHDVVEESLAVRRKIGYLPESTPLYDDMPVADYLRYCGRLRRMGGRHLRERIQTVVGMTSLGPKYRAPIKTLSKGYRQRVGIAQALLHEPEIVILDEPTVGLDPNQVIDARNLIAEVGERRTVILCSHILPEVEAVCSRVVIIDRGRLVKAGTPAALSAETGEKAFFEVSAVSEPEALSGALAAVDGVHAVASTGHGEGVAHARFESGRPGAEVGRDVSASLAERGLMLVSFTPRRASLEEVFRLATREGDA